MVGCGTVLQQAGEEQHGAALARDIVTLTKELIFVRPFNIVLGVGYHSSGAILTEIRETDRQTKREKEREKKKNGEKAKKGNKK